MTGADKPVVLEPVLLSASRATLVFDGRLLRAGRNVISIGRTPRLKGTNDHYTFKKIRLQLKYPRN